MSSPHSQWAHFAHRQLTTLTALASLTSLTLLTALTVSSPNLPQAHLTHNTHHKLILLTASFPCSHSLWGQGKLTSVVVSSPCSLPAHCQLTPNHHKLKVSSPHSPLAHLQLTMLTSSSVHSPCSLWAYCELTSLTVSSLCSARAHHAQCSNLANLTCNTVKPPLEPAEALS